MKMKKILPIFRILSAVVLAAVLTINGTGWTKTTEAATGGATAVAPSESECPITAVCGPAPHIAPKVVNEHAGKKILFDNTHGETAGAADWVINGGFSDFAEGLAEDGFEIQELRKSGPITYDDLKDYDVFVIPEANIPFKQSEQQALLDYVDAGGSLFFIGDHYNADRNKNRWDASEIFNGYRRGAFDDPTKGMSDSEKSSAAMQGVTSSDWLAEHFGVRFRYNAIGDVTADRITAPEDAFGITEGVHAVAMHAGSTLAILDPAHAKGLVYLPENPPAWSNAVDQGVYDGGGTAEGPMVAIAKRGLGKAAFIGDSSPIEDDTPFYVREDTGQPKTTYDGFEEQDDAVLLIHLFDWLAEQEDYTSFADRGIPLDQPTALHDFEQPAQSVEPQPEPWSPPNPGYEWWNPATFAAGSYGSGKTLENPTYGFVHQDELPANGQIFKIRVTGDHWAPFAEVSNLRVGLYLPGGEQVGQFSQDGTSWPSAYGYSEPFAMTADASGHAETELYVRIKTGALGAANLRLKQGSNNLYTESVTIANVAPEPLPPGEGGETPEAIAVADARNLPEGSVVTVEGVATTRTGLWGGKGFYVQDGTGGIYVYQQNEDIEPGEKVKITGQTTEYNGEREISPVYRMERSGTADLPAPLDVTPGGVAEANEGRLVRLNKVTVADVRQADVYGTTEFTAVGEDGSVTVRLDNRTGTTFDDFPYHNGDVLDIVGISSEFKGTRQVKPRSLDDLKETDVVAPETAAELSGTKLSDGSFMKQATIRLSATDDRSGIEKTIYRVNAGSWSDYSAPIRLTADGVAMVAYRSVDKAGNWEPIKTAAVAVTAPTFANLYALIDRSPLRPAIKIALKVHVKAAERAKGDTIQRRQLQKTLDFVAHLPDRLIGETAKQDLEIFLNAWLH